MRSKQGRTDWSGAPSKRQPPAGLLAVGPLEFDVVFENENCPSPLVLASQPLGQSNPFSWILTWYPVEVIAKKAIAVWFADY